MVKTHGLTHIALAVRDAERSLRFYHGVFGVEAYCREDGRIHVKTLDCHDVIPFDELAPNPGTSGGIIHFGFRLKSPPTSTLPSTTSNKPAASSSPEASSPLATPTRTSRTPTATNSKSGSSKSRFRFEICIFQFAI
jgi:hypothetical protein